MESFDLPLEPEGKYTEREVLSRENKAETGSAETLISGATTLEDLYEVLEKIGTITGTQASYPAEKLISYIEKIKDGKMHVDYITRACGLRDKVIEILGLEETD